MPFDLDFAGEPDLALLVRLAWVAALAVALAFLARFLRGAISRRVADRHTRHRLRQTVSLGAWLGFVLLLVAAFSESLGQLAVILGVVGAAVTFALQEVIASMAGWLSTSLGGHYRVGDRVKVGGVRGDVIDVGVLRTTLMETGEWVAGDLYSGRIVRVPNSAVLREPIYNYTADFPFLWDELQVPVAYGSDAEEARALLEAAADEVVGAYAERVAEGWATVVRRYDIEDARLEPMVSMAATDNWLAYTLRYVVDVKQRRGTRDALTRAILARIDATEGRVRLASATFALVEAPELDVRLRRADDDPPG